MDTAALESFAARIPVDETLLAPMGLMTWAAIRLHHGIRDTIGLLDGALSNAPFDNTLGGAIVELEKKAESAGKPWSAEIREWASTYGRPAAALRDRITHAVAFTAADGTHALITSLNRRHKVRERVTKELLVQATGSLVLASTQLDQARNRCRSAGLESI